VSSTQSPEYQASIAEAALAIKALTISTMELRDCYGGRPNPGVLCPALADLAHQSDYAGAPDDQPIDNLMSMVELLIQAGNDHLRALGVLVQTEPTIVSAHLPVARAALEAFAFARWLAECPIERDTCVKRGLLMRLDDAKQLARFSIPAFTSKSQQNKASIRYFAKANGWAMSIGKMTIGGETLIDTKSALDRLFGDPLSIKSAAPKLWCYLSGAGHGNAYALIQSVDRDDGESNESTQTVSLVVRAGDVHNLVATALLAGIRAWEMATCYFGWDMTQLRKGLIPVHEYLKQTARALASEAAAAAAAA
jgi:hypothetical protein